MGQGTKKPVGLMFLTGCFLAIFGAPGEIRTPDPLVRSQVLYPTELRARNVRDYADGA
jgi:hypothetical protein